MKRADKVVIALFVAAVVVGCALLIRDGLLSVAKAIRDKPWPRMPETVNISEVTVRHATMEAGRAGTNSTNGVKVTIENMKIDAQLPPAKPQ